MIFISINIQNKNAYLLSFGHRKSIATEYYNKNARGSIPVSEMTCTVSSGTLNPSIPYRGSIAASISTMKIKCCNIETVSNDEKVLAVNIAMIAVVQC